MINTIRRIALSGKEEKMKIQEQGEVRVTKENEQEKRKKQWKMMQSAYHIVSVVLVPSNRSTVS